MNKQQLINEISRLPDNADNISWKEDSPFIVYYAGSKKYSKPLAQHKHVNGLFEEMNQCIEKLSCRIEEVEGYRHSGDQHIRERVGKLEDNLEREIIEIMNRRIKVKFEIN